MLLPGRVLRFSLAVRLSWSFVAAVALMLGSCTASIPAAVRDDA
jgi:hypothetical protein